MSDILSPVGREKPVATQAIPLERNGSGDSISTGSSLRNEKDGANPQAELLSEDVAAKVADLRAKLNETKIHGLYNRQSWVINEAMTQIGYGRYQRCMSLYSGLGWMVDNMIIQGLSISLPFLSREFDQTEQSTRNATVALSTGMTIGAFFWSSFSDSRGRRSTFFCTIPLAAMFILVAAFMPHWILLCACIALAGIGAGGSLANEGVFFLESMAPKETTRVILQGTWWATGYFLVNSIAYQALLFRSCERDVESCALTHGVQPCCNPRDSPGWRIIFFIVAIFAIVVAALRQFVCKPVESPKYFISKSRPREAVNAVKQIATRNGKETWLGERVLEEVSREDENGRSGSVERPISRVWQRLRLGDVIPWLENRRLQRTVIGLALAYPALGLAYPLFAAFLPQFFRSIAGGAHGMPDDILLRNNIITAACTLPAGLAAYYLIDLPRIGRKWTLVASTAISGIILFLFAFLATEKLAALYTSLTLFFQNIMYSVLYGYAAERVPAPIRARINGYLSALNRIAGLSAPILATYATGMHDKGFICVSGGLFILGSIVFLLITETRGETSL